MHRHFEVVALVTQPRVLLEPIAQRVPDVLPPDRAVRLRVVRQHRRALVRVELVLPLDEKPHRANRDGRDGILH